VFHIDFSFFSGVTPRKPARCLDFSSFRPPETRKKSQTDLGAASSEKPPPPGGGGGGGGGATPRRYRTTTAQIMKLNKLKNANKLREGQRLRIPVRR